MRFSSMDWARPLLGIFLLLVSDISECLQMAVHPDVGTTVTLETPLPAEECCVCRVGGDGASEEVCSSSLTLEPDKDVNLLFNCSSPAQEAFTISIHKKIECTKEDCNPAVGEIQPSLFTDFNRTFVWNVTGPMEARLGLTFPGDGLKEVTSLEACPDGYRYTVVSSQPDEDGRTDAFCRKGPVSHIDLPHQALVSLQVPGEENVDPTIFQIAPLPVKKKGRMIPVAPDTGTSITIQRDTAGPDCTVCSTEGSKAPQCSSKLALRDTHNVSVEFSCTRPQDIFRVEVNREIDCDETTCSGDIVQGGFSLFPEFNRTFTWDLKVPSTRAFQVDFSGLGMRQILPSESCLDEHTYSIITYLRTGPLTIGTFCQNGTISLVQVLYRGRLALKVPGESQPDPATFKVSVGPQIKKLAVVKVTLPPESSAPQFFSANYPGRFPDDDLMMWNFTVPPKHNATVRFLEYTEPECLKKDVTVEYEREGGKFSMGKELSVAQPANLQRGFGMSLINCETDRRGNRPGLSLSFQVSVFRSSHAVLCTLDLHNEEGLSVRIETRNPSCEMKVDGVLQETVTLLSGTKSNLSFQDCSSEDLFMTVSKTIECRQWEACPVGMSQLSLPTLEACLPMPMQSMTWQLRVPEDGTVELLPSAGSLRQSLPGQECKGRFTVRVTEDGGVPFGEFCAGGAISKVQIHSNVTVVATPTKARSLSEETFFNVSFSREIKESYILTVSPRVEASALVSSPNWPGGMKPSSTASWVVMLPPEYQAELVFTNVSQPKCAERHTSIKVQTLGSPEEMFSRREDEERESKLTVPQSFFLNTSNCVPEEGHFSVLSTITLQKRRSHLLSIILGTVGALLLLMIIVLIAVCVVVRKKKRKADEQASIYIPKGNIFLPGDSPFPKSRANNESHVYASIEDTMVYGHLLQDPGNPRPLQGQYQGPQVDTYRSFAGPTDNPSEKAALDAEVGVYRPFLDPSQGADPPRPRTPLGRQDSLAFVDTRMVGNELNTFKSNGDITPLRLSAVEPVPAVEEGKEWEDDDEEDEGV
ncbi:hypothetical protein MATL_G00233840 [Megalops atlanticus]|uniref:CUB domain-containing protein 1-like n=1 Tax=Megalops atlanticus TaxID=7932 RepID=A0A9D3PIJ4_MEGAT|nr:hypothetical protein MATL_G00233840 [Megalops atlanticus]